ncbi:hypothetical protein [Actinoplanes sp. HUAS TT8]|uniref:hypothetical protein n=1 Tax=Actinoplanes sp. HUAS TT8 TaxID=3447453 RepID=UPI003F5229A7
MASASPPVALPSPNPSPPAPPPARPDRWRWPRALLTLPLPLLLIWQARRKGVVSPLLDRVDPTIVSALVVLASGVYCHVLAARLHKHGVPRLAAAFIVAGPGLAICAVGTTDLPSMIGMALVVVALDGYLRFVVDGQTLGGFVAGITLACAAVCDLATLVYMAALAAAVPFLAGTWARQVKATTAILAVLAFPSVAVYLGWLYVRWRFGAGSPHNSTPMSAFDPVRGAVTAISGLAHCLLYVVSAAAVARRRRSALPAYLLPVAVVALLVAVGASRSTLVINLFFTAVAVTAIRTHLPRRDWAILAGVAAAQIGLVLMWPP